MKKIIGSFCLLAVLLSSAALAADISIEAIINNVQANQSKITDMYAETTTTMTSSMTLSGQESSAPKKVEQKGKMWTKGQDRSKVEIISPVKQITIINGDQMAIINPDTGQKIVQDLTKLKDASGGQALGRSGGQMNLAKAKELFGLTVEGQEGAYIVRGIPKKTNQFIAKMEFYIDSEKWVPTKIVIYDAKNNPISQSAIDYQEISGVWVPVSNKSAVATPMGKIAVEMTYDNIKVNSGIKDETFKID
jgi:outer membrane lipoprotein-sorting protein